MNNIDIKKMTIKEIKELLDKDSVDSSFLNSLKKDKRAGVKNLLDRYYKKRKALEEEKKLLKELLYYEEGFFKKGIYPVAGIDEAGRGPLAGPVFAAAVILPLDCNILGIRDSKKLSKVKREKLYLEIKEKAISWAVSWCSPQMIDKYNIYEATKIAMIQAVHKLKVKPKHLLIDAVKLDILPTPQTVLSKGETKSVSIAAASILAKVSRDKYMENLALKYPDYEFEIHKGYPTKRHYEILKKLGPCKEHRLTFSGVLNK